MQYKIELFSEYFEKLENDSKKQYEGMPDYNNEKKPPPIITATFKFRSKEDFDYFHKVVKENLYDNKKVFDGMQRKEEKQAWFPLPPRPSHFKYIEDEE